MSHPGVRKAAAGIAFRRRLRPRILWPVCLVVFRSRATARSWWEAARAMNANDIVILVVGIAVITLVGAVLLLKVLKRQLGRTVAAAVDPAAILMQDHRANFFGIESKGVLQVRGNGALVLTETALEFFMLVPSTRITVPLEEVTRVGLVKSHLGKTIFRDLLKVWFRRGDELDSIVWYVPAPQAWRDRIDTLIRG